MKKGKWIIFIVLCIGTSACTLPSMAMTFSTPVAGPSQTWIDAPLPNSNLPLLPYKLVFHGASFVGVTEFELRINGVVIAEVPPVSSSSGGSQMGTLFLGEYLWSPSAPGTYLIAVRAKGNGQFSSPDQVQVTISEVEIVSEETMKCIFTALVSLNCRIGPGMDYEAIDAFSPDQTAPVLGRTSDGFYLYVNAPNSGRMCTVPTAQKYGKTEGDCSALPMFTPMPLPTPTATEEPMGCTFRRPSDEVIVCVVPCPAGAEPGEPCTP
jgi:hypothetical protein